MYCHSKENDWREDSNVNLGVREYRRVLKRWTVDDDESKGGDIDITDDGDDVKDVVMANMPGFGDDESKGGDMDKTYDGDYMVDVAMMNMPRFNGVEIVWAA